MILSLEKIHTRLVNSKRTILGQDEYTITINTKSDVELLNTSLQGLRNLGYLVRVYVWNELITPSYGSYGSYEQENPLVSYMTDNDLRYVKDVQYGSKCFHVFEDQLTTDFIFDQEDANDYSINVSF